MARAQESTSDRTWASAGLVSVSFAMVLLLVRAVRESQSQDE